MNGRLEGLYVALGRAKREFVCECGFSGCSDRIVLTADEYATVRSHATRFAIVPGHQIDAIERLVEVNERFAVVEKPVSPYGEMAARAPA